MALTPGSRLGPYEIIAPLGAGGMGEVFRARDVKLNREVALKVLPVEVARDPERLSRFEREAQLLASLNHPNIAAIYGVDDEDDVLFLVLELVPGEDLAERLKRGPIPLDEALELARQIAMALEEAHETGIIHRDLKPANVKLTPEGKVKVLDFGLAKAFSTEVSGGAPLDSGNSPTMTHAATMAGMILGTAAYMSPEQARAKSVDKRADIWAFGVVLHEMLTGAQLFHGETVSDTLAAVLTRELDPATLPAGTPASIRRLLRHCLERNPKNRLHDIADARIVIDEHLTHRGETEEPLTSAGQRRPWVPMALVAGSLAAGALIGSLVFSGRATVSAGSSGSAETAVIAKSLLTDIPGIQQGPSLSPDGKTLLFVSRGPVDDDIFSLRVGGENPVNLTGSGAGRDAEPAYSPDGERIAFSSEREGGGIFVMGATGESPRKLSSEGFHPAWSPDGRSIIYTTEQVATPYGRNSKASLWIVDVAAGSKKRLYEGDAVQPAWSPSGRRIAFWEVGQGRRDIKTMAAEGGVATAVTNDVSTDWGPFWAPDGRSLFFMSDRGGSPDLWRVAIDEATGETRGAPEPVTSGVAPVMAGSISADGKRIAIQITQSQGEILRLSFDPATVRVRGEPVSIFASAHPLFQLDLSADARWITYRTFSPTENIFVMRADGGERRRLTDDAFRNRGPIWIRGEWLLFYSNRSGSYEMWLMRRDGTDLRMVTNRPDLELGLPSVSPDGSRVAFSLAYGETPKLGMAPVQDSWFAAGAAPEPIAIETVADAFLPTVWSPDGKLIGGFVHTPKGVAAATYSTATRRVEVHERLHASIDFRFAWMPDSRRVLYWDGLRNTAVVYDLDAKNSKDVAGIPGPCEPTLSSDGRTLMVNRTVLEGDIWLLTLK